MSKSQLRLTWKVAKVAAGGDYTVTASCATKRRGSNPKAVSSTVRVASGSGQAAMVRAARISVAARSSKRNAKLKLTEGLPAGKGDPRDANVALPPNVGGGEFSTYWPLATGARATITEAAGGRFSHSSPATKDSIDLGLPQGTELRAGFTGVVARVNTGCVVGNTRCGSGYGNYIYLKAPDGTCAVLGHLSQVDVAQGQQIARYDRLGLSGTTGNSTGPHLHYNHIDCNTGASLPWSPAEGGPVNEGATVTSGNAPDAAVQAPPTTPTPTPAPQPRGFTVEDSYLGGTWARTDPDDGTWHNRNDRPANGAYWYANGLGVAVDCVRRAATYVVSNKDGHKEDWNLWLHVTDGKWYPAAASREASNNADTYGLTTC
ncbi:MAG: M23 family metallopeptidase [Patulibacter minatonensis]